MQELVKAIKGGDRARLAELYKRNTGLLVTIARRYYGIDPMVSIDDLTQAGFFGLVAAVDAWEPERGAWSNIAILHVKKAMCEVLGIRTTRKRAHLDTISLDAPLPGNEDGTGMDLLTDESLPDSDMRVLKDEVALAIHAAVSSIPNPRQAEAIRLLHLEKDEDACRVLGCSRARVHQLEAKGMEVMRRDKRLRDLARAYNLDLDLNTRFHAHKGVAAFNVDWTSVTEAAALWRIEHEFKGQARGFSGG
ncbi:MAG: sigma-70 family RNA polymerase sigma factor [Christensenellaceae bacterium]|nr:sigma-70 family RNA polymerase sigma factor [Christensenellaceae bacterium]